MVSGVGWRGAGEGEAGLKHRGVYTGCGRLTQTSVSGQRYRSHYERWVRARREWSADGPFHPSVLLGDEWDHGGFEEMETAGEDVDGH